MLGYPLLHLPQLRQRVLLEADGIHHNTHLPMDDMICNADASKCDPCETVETANHREATRENSVRV